MTTEETFRAPVRLTVRTPVDLIAAIPYLVGFHPERSIVVLGADARGGSVDFVVGCEPLREPVTDPVDLAARLCAPFLRDGRRRALIVGYGPDTLIGPCVGEIRSRLARLDVTVAEALRLAGGRYWSYTCHDETCCPPEGVPYDIHHSAIPATAVTAGLSPRADRAELLALTAPVEGAERTEMERATLDAEERFSRLWRQPGRRTGGSCTAEGIRTVRAVVAAAVDGAPPPDPRTVARLGLLLVDLRTRDEAWAHIDRACLPAHIGLWSHVLRRVAPAYVAAPASLLAFAAWQNEDPLLADAALNRVAETDPDYSMAQLVRKALHYGVPPHSWHGFTPEWLAEQSPVTDDTEIG